MATPQKIREYLENNNVSYWHRIHPVAFTAQELADVDHVSGRKVAKTVVLQADGHWVMAVLPADHAIDMEALQAGLHCKNLLLASEGEFVRLFPGCQPGAMPPFGKLFKLPLYCDRRLASQREIEFNGGTHTDSLRMWFSDFVKLEKPVVLDFSEKATGQRRACCA